MKDVFYVTGDLHLTNKNSKFRVKDGVSDLLEAQRDFCEEFAESAKAEENLSGVLFLGDWSDYTNFDPVMQTYSIDCFDELCVDDVQNIFVTGNHTVYGSDNAYSVLNAKQNFVGDDVFIGDMIERFGPMSDTDHDIKFLIVPYHEDYDQIVEEIDKYNEYLYGHDKYGKDRIDILLFHFPIMGATLDNQYASKGGAPLKEENVNNFDLCLGGDFHRPQQVYDNLYYVGAPFELKFGENDCPRGYVRLVIEDGEIETERVPNPFNYEMVRVDGYKEFREFFHEKVSGEYFRGIVKVEGEISEQERIRILEKGSLFYRLILPPIGSTSDKGEEEVIEVEKSEVFQKNDDVKKVKEKLDSYEDIESDLTNEAVTIFKEVF